MSKTNPSMKTFLRNLTKSENSTSDTFKLISLTAACNMFLLNRILQPFPRFTLTVVLVDLLDLAFSEITLILQPNKKQPFASIPQNRCFYKICKTEKRTPVSLPFFNNVASVQPATLFKKTLKIFSCVFFETLRTIFLQSTFGRLLLWNGFMISLKKTPLFLIPSLHFPGSNSKII